MELFGAVLFDFTAASEVLYHSLYIAEMLRLAPV